MLSYSCLSCKRQAKVNIVHAQVNKKMCGHSGVVMVPEAVPEKLEPITLCFEGSRTMKTTVANSKTVINPQCTHVQRLLRKCVSDRLSVCLSVTRFLPPCATRQQEYGRDYCQNYALI